MKSLRTLRGLAATVTTAALMAALPAAHAADYTVGFVTSLVGPVSSLGIPYQKGIQAGQAYQSEIDGRKVRLIQLDDASDPSTAARNARKLIEGVDYADNAYHASEGADAVVIVTEWNQFRALDFTRLKTVMKAPILIDLRNIYRPDEVARHGFSYTSVGRAD